MSFMEAFNQICLSQTPWPFFLLKIRGVCGLTFFMGYPSAAYNLDFFKAEIQNGPYPELHFLRHISFPAQNNEPLTTPIAQ